MSSAIKRPVELVKRVVSAITSPPACAECEGRAEEGWQVSASGKVYGLCRHCAEGRGRIQGAARGNM
jgi:hypothetical protein